LIKNAILRPGLWVFLLVGTAAFLQLLSTYVRVYSPGYGITKLIVMGHEFDQRGLAVYRATPKYMAPSDRWGFDGQHYAQIALDPLLRDPQLKIALDNPPYRARRILLPWLAWLGGLGQPFWILNVYAALNLIFWTGFAVMLIVLFRPLGWPGLAGFAAMLMTCGIIESMRSSLTDFPGFVLVTLAMMIGGTGGAGVLALAALTREPNIMGLVGLWDYRPPWLTTAKRNLLLALIAAGPMLLWFAYVASRFPLKEAIDGDNIAWPLRGIMAKLGELSVRAGRGEIHWHKWYTEFYTSEPFHALLTIIATLTQCIYLLTHREWTNRLWRVGALFVPFFLCISFLSWESHFTVTRHALPITLAFNLVLAMRARRSWIVWFVLGNCFVPFGIYQFSVYGSSTLNAPAEYRIARATSPDLSLDVRYGDGWSKLEWTRKHTWRWAVNKRASLVLINPTKRPLEVEMFFTTRSIFPRDLVMSTPGAEIWSRRVGAAPIKVQTSKFPLPPGETAITFSSPQAPVRPDSFGDDRQLAFLLQDLRFNLVAPSSGP
jgi:hypothetical protein